MIGRTALALVVALVVACSKPSTAPDSIGVASDAGLSSIETRVPFGLTMRVTHDDRTRVKGVLRGWTPKDHDGKRFDVAGTFDAEVCPRTCL